MPEKPLISTEHTASNPISSPSQHGLLFDAAVLVGLVLFYLDLTPIPSPSLEADWGSDAVPERVIGFWLAGGLLVQILGALLKGPSLRYRLLQRKYTPGKALRRLITLLWWGHFLFFTLITVLSLGLLGWEPPENDTITGPYMLWGLTIFTIGGITTMAALWAGKPGKEAQPTPPTRPVLEYLGDFLLLVSVLILTRIIWEPMSMLFTTGEIGFEAGLVQVLMRGVLFLCMLCLFVVFYLPPRLLFLVEDGRYRRTWLQMGIVVVPLTWHVFFGL